MIVYNVTIKVEASIAAAWLQWLKEEHIPMVISTGCFTHASVLHLLETDEEEGPTYAAQYFSPSLQLYQTYIEKHAAHMRSESFNKWGNKFIAFRSVMEVVN